MVLAKPRFPNIPPFAKAVFLVLVAIFLFSVMSAIIKHLGVRYPVQQLSAFRNLFGLIPAVLMLLASQSWHVAGRPLAIRQWKLAFIRGGFIAIAQYCLYLSLTHLELATASTIVFAAPLFVTALSVPVLGDRVGMWRWLAVFIGFAGIVLVMRPGSDVFTSYALLPLGAALSYSCASVSVRLIDSAVPTATINLYSHVGALIGSTGIVVATDGYVSVASYIDWLWILAIGIVGGGAVLCLNTAYRRTQPSNLSPFEYFGIPFSILLGWFFFAEAPFDKLFPGVVLIVGGGFLIIWRERRLSRRRQALIDK